MTWWLGWLAISGACPGTDCEGLYQPHYDTATVPEGQATDPDVRITPAWAGLQLVPSPGVTLGDEGAHLRLSWQVTPVLYSFGMDPRLNPWRSFVVEPIVRASGSIELYLSPEYVSIAHAWHQRFGYRVGLRSTFALLQRGDYLALSLGTGYLALDREESAEYELGLYVLYGSIGLTAQYAPGLSRATYTSTLKVRFF